MSSSFSVKNVQSGVEHLLPGVALMAPAFWVAWVELIYAGEIYLSDTAPTSLGIIVSYCISTSAMAVMLIVYACLSRRVQGLVLRPGLVVLAGLGATASTLLTLLNVGFAATAFTGVFTSFLVARFCFVLAQVKPKEILLSAVLIQILASFIYGFVLATPEEWQPVFMCALPFLGACASLLDGGNLTYGSIEADDRGPDADFIRLVVAIGVLSIGINIVRGFYPNMVEMASFAEARGNSSVLFFLVKMACCFLIACLPLKSNLSHLCYYCLLLLVLLTLAMPLFGLGSSTSLEFFGCVNALLNIVVWTLLLSISYKSGASPIRLFGWGWGTLSLGSVVGWLIGYGLYQFGFRDDGLLPIEVGILGVVLVAGVVVVSRDVIDRLFRPVDDEEGATGMVSLGAEREMRGPDKVPAGPCPVEVLDIEWPEDEDAAADERLGTAGYDRSQDGAGPAEGARRPGPWRSAMTEMGLEMGLSRRELDVFELLLKGHSKSSVAEDLTISYNTVRSHVRSIYMKCDVHNQQELIDAFELRYRGKRDADQAAERA